MSTYSTETWLALGSIGLLIGAGLGALIHAWWLRRAARAHRRIPKHWPLRQRLVASSEERKIWHWLTQSFPDHSVMLKMSVTRFTLPLTKELGQHWFELLSGLHCTFTVTTADGQVIGCADVAGQLRLPKKNRILKETLLNQCGIAYIVLESARLPSVQDIRIEFLGDMACMPHDREHERSQAAVISASASLRESLKRQRKTRDHSPLTANADGHHDSLNHNDSSSFPILWQHNSFIMPLDSCKGELH